MRREAIAKRFLVWARSVIEGRSTRDVAPPAEPSARPSASVRTPAPLRVDRDERPGTVHVIAVVVGLPQDELEAVVDRIAQAGAVVPVFLTDDDAFAVFRIRRIAFEYLPPPGPDPELDWELYRLRRLALLRRKWQPARIVAFGGAASALVRAWRGSPFEDEAIATLTGVGPVPPADG